MKQVCVEIKNQTNRVVGQMNGIERMINDGRDPDEIIQQISAVRSALSRLAVEVLKDESHTCFKEKNEVDKVKKFEKLVSSFFKVT